MFFNPTTNCIQRINICFSIINLDDFEFYGLIKNDYLVIIINFRWLHGAQETGIIIIISSFEHFSHRTTFFGN